MVPHITVCICTYRREKLLRRLLDELAQQQTERAFSFSISVCDNDANKSALPVVSEFGKQSAIEVSYTWEPQPNIALARNRALQGSQGEFIAFIDDDEVPVPDWLARSLEACLRYGVAGVLGPVRPHFEHTPPQWVVRGRFCERPEPPTGEKMKWYECRTGNLLFRRSMLEDRPEPFDARFPNGGEDKDFFMHMTERGFSFVWCNEAVVHETVPPVRCTRRFMLKRALLRGRNILKHPKGRFQALSRSLLALPLYSAVLPFTLLFGQQYFMKYSIKLCDHLGRFLALAGLNTIERQT